LKIKVTKIIVKTYFTLVLLYIGFSAYGQSVNWTNTKDWISIGQDLIYYNDSTNNKAIKDVIALKEIGSFKPISNKIFRYPSSKGDHWFYFDLENPHGHKLLLEINQAILSDIQLYSKAKNGSWEASKGGYNIPWHEKSSKEHAHSFSLDPNTSQYFLKVRPSFHPMEFKIWEEEKYEIFSVINKILQSIIIGLMLFVILYNIFMYFTVKRREYLVYVLLVLGYLLFSLTTSGYLSYFIPNANLTIVFKWLPIILQPLGLYYTFIFLNVDKYPDLHKWTKYVLYYLFSYWIWSNFLSDFIVENLNQANAMVGMSVMIYIGWYIGKKGDRLGYYFGLAYLMMFIFGALETSYLQFGWPSYNFGISHISIAFLLEVIILSYLLTKRLEWENKAAVQEREEAQLKLINSTIEQERLVRDQNMILEKEVNLRTQQLQKSIDDLKITQNQLIQSEKMASLGELTAGIAHEIRNPLNFINNFSEVSKELIDEMKDEIDRGNFNDVKGIADMMSQNLEKITHHGKRADSIVNGMLQHSRKNNGDREVTDINALCDEYLRLAFHGFKAKDRSFTAAFETELDPNLPKIKVVTQDIGRVILNIINNAFYAVNEKAHAHPENYNPKVVVKTQVINSAFVQITIADNGNGIPDKIKDKIFQPFFTTKPTGQGTGLGLSLSYDIIHVGHNGEMKVESDYGKGTEFVIKLPI
jgi:two-component system, NtrC family, sensor kinase